MKAAESDCDICLALFEEFVLVVGLYTQHQADSIAGWIKRLKTELSEVLGARLDDMEALSNASLSVMNQPGEDDESEGKIPKGFFKAIICLYYSTWSPK